MNKKIIIVANNFKQKNKIKNQLKIQKTTKNKQKFVKKCIFCLFFQLFYYFFKINLFLTQKTIGSICCEVLPFPPLSE